MLKSQYFENLSNDRVRKKFWETIKQKRAMDRSILFSKNLEEEMSIEKIENEKIYINVTTAESFMK